MLASMLRASPRQWLSQTGRPSVRAFAAAADTGSAKPVRILGISGSLRKSSKNTGLLRAIAKKPPAGTTFEMADISQLPLYNDDLWQGLDMKNDDSKLPQAVREFRSKVQQADVVLFATPEYNFSVSGPLKNAIDWTSKGPNLWNKKLVSAVAAAGGSQGARSALALNTIVTSLGAFYPPAGSKPVFTSAFGPQFDQEGNVTDPKLEEALITHAEFVASWSSKFKQLFA